MDEQKRAEQTLRKRLAKENRYYGDCCTPKVSEVESLGYDVDENVHTFAVTFERRLLPRLYDVRLYAKSARIWRA